MGVPQRAVLQLLGETDERVFKEKLKNEIVLAALKIMQPNLKRVSERVSIDLPDQPKAERIENAEVKSKTIVKRRIVKKAQEKFVAPKVKKKRIFGNKT